MSATKGITRAQKLDMAARRARGETLAQIAAAHDVTIRTVRHHLTWREPRQLSPCGTNAAYARHLRRGQQPCPDCCAAHAEDTRNRKAAA